MYLMSLASCVVVFFSLHGLIPTTRIGIRQRNGIYQSLIPYLVKKIFDTSTLTFCLELTPAGMQRRASDDGSDEAARDIS